METTNGICGRTLCLALFAMQRETREIPRAICPGLEGPTFENKRETLASSMHHSYQIKAFMSPPGKNAQK